MSEDTPIVHALTVALDLNMMRELTRGAHVVSLYRDDDHGTEFEVDVYFAPSAGDSAVVAEEVPKLIRAFLGQQN